MELEELKHKHKEIGEAIAKLEQVPKFWEPKDGEEAWYICASDSLRTSTHWNVAERAIGIAHQTKELAEQDLAIKLATQRLKKAIFYINEGKSYPFTRGNENCHIIFNQGKLELDSWSAYKTIPNWMYMKDTNACEQLISERKDDLLLVLGQ